MIFWNWKFKFSKNYKNSDFVLNQIFRNKEWNVFYTEFKSAILLFYIIKINSNDLKFLEWVFIDCIDTLQNEYLLLF